jgi:CTP synthase (UTP-ammonia lyase)
MEKRIQIGLVGDFNEKKHTLVALNQSIEHCKPHLKFDLTATWIPTVTLPVNFLVQSQYDGFWIVPGSPYENDDGVYALIRWTRENNFPILGTCGGFQYMVVEYSKNVLGFKNAGHEESEPGVENLIISKMACSLKGSQEQVHITDHDSWLYRILKTNVITGHFNCNYGVNPVYQKLIDQYPLAFTAFSEDGEARALEIKGHHFYNGTLFQPPLDSSFDKPNPLLMDFFESCAKLK